MRGVSRAAGRRYARALLDVALAKGVAESLRRELREAVVLLGSQRDLGEVLDHPGLPAERKRAIVGRIWNKQQAGELLRRLLELLVERGRLALLATIEQVFGELWNAQRGVAAAEAVSAVALDEAETRALARALEKATGKTVELVNSVDPAVLGGLLVRLEGKVYDGTLRAQLGALRERLVAGASRA